MKRRSTIIIPMDALAGSSVKNVAEDMVSMAKRLDCGVTMNMNGVLTAFPDTTVAELKRDYEEGISL